VCVVLAPDRKVESLLTLRELEVINPKRVFAIFAGRTVILDARIGGLAKSGLLEPKESAAPPTVDEDALAEKEASAASHLWDDSRLKAIGFRVRRVAHNASSARAGDRPRDWRVVYQRFVDAESEEAGSEDALEWRVEAFVGDRPARSDPAITNVNQELDRHHADAKRWTERIADRLRLPEPLRQVLVEAAGVHDSGKERRNWQAFAGNPRWARDPRENPPLAKFSRGGGPALLKIGDEVYRHEFGSLHDVVSQPAPVKDVREEWRDLFLHVLAAHHGHARPVITAIDEKHPPELCAIVARAAALRFVRLQKRFGPWGLAWLEALLRAADVAASRALSTTVDDTAPLPAKEEAA
jgi:CRISPR-associated endonuclease/helicase Cas3